MCSRKQDKEIRSLGKRRAAEMHGNLRRFDNCTGLAMICNLKRTNNLQELSELNDGLILNKSRQIKVWEKIDHKSNSPGGLQTKIRRMDTDKSRFLD